MRVSAVPTGSEAQDINFEKENIKVKYEEKIGKTVLDAWSVAIEGAFDRFEKDKDAGELVEFLFNISSEAIALLAARVDLMEEECCEGKCGFKSEKPNFLDVNRILKSGDRTIVFWEDGEKTIVKKMEGEEDSSYDAFAAALAKRIYGNNSQIRKMIQSKLEYQKKDTEKNAVQQEISE